MSELDPNSNQSAWHYAQYCARTVMAKEYFGYTLPEAATPPYKKEFVGAIVGPMPNFPLTYRCSVRSTLELHDHSIVKWLARLHSDTAGTDWFLDSFDFFDGTGKAIKSYRSVKKL